MNVSKGCHRYHFEIKTLLRITNLMHGSQRPTESFENPILVFTSKGAMDENMVDSSSDLRREHHLSEMAM